VSFQSVADYLLRFVVPFVTVGSRDVSIYELLSDRDGACYGRTTQNAGSRPWTLARYRSGCDSVAGDAASEAHRTDRP